MGIPHGNVANLKLYHVVEGEAFVSWQRQPESSAIAKPWPVAIPTEVQCAGT